MNKKTIFIVVVFGLLLSLDILYYLEISPTSMRHDVKMLAIGCSKKIPNQYKRGQCQNLRDYLHIGDCFKEIAQIDLPSILKDPNCCQQFDDPDENNNDLDYLCYGEYGEQIGDKKLCNGIMYQDGKNTCDYFFDRKHMSQ